ncbi:trypsin-like peptidase domain-containing protein [Candidatus Woesearchaeota archaeon]|nr:trypsin-like peptidase domain-containing protein [Candidatus Woesearchaeota archaeon]USN44687.1 MAG: trypsin-like peptidase domain-containing protein [Candidatus Woesearchaeota archaeon]
MSFTLDLTKVGNQLLFTTLRLEVTLNNGCSAVGTGFIVSKKIDPLTERHYLITNKHVIEHAKEGRLIFNIQEGTNSVLGKEVYSVTIPENFEKIWHLHPGEIDLCLTSLAPILALAAENGKKLFYKSIPREIFLDEETKTDLDVFEDICFIGYPNGIYDEKNHLPIFRTGTTASHVAIAYGGRPVFIIDASVFPGSSGSPVFIYDKNSYNKGKDVHIGSRLLFLGVVSETLIKNKTGEVEVASVPTTTVGKSIVRLQEMLDLGVVINSDEVSILIEDFEKRNFGETEF